MPADIVGDVVVGSVAFVIALITFITGKLPIARLGIRTTYGDRRDAPILWWLLWSMFPIFLCYIGADILARLGYEVRLPGA